MRFQKFNILLIGSATALLTACDIYESVPLFERIEKTPIELSVGGLDTQEPATRAVVTDGTGKTLRAFSGQTRLFFAMVAEDGSGNKKYGFNYGTAAAVSNPAVDSKSTITFPDNYLYWDDAYARDSKVSVYSIAVANKERGNVALTDNGSIAIGTESPGKAIIPFSTTDPGSPTFKWQIGDSDGSSAYKQDQNIFDWADLVFSNNIADYSSGSGTDNRLKFHTEAGEKYHKFDKGELIYYHALTQFTIKIKCGEGFKGDGTDFQFTNLVGSANNSFGLNGFYGGNGIFRIGNGEFETMTNRNYTSIYKVSETHQKADAGDYYILKAYVFPGTDMSGTKNDAFSFVIDGNKYDVSLANLFTALQNGTTDGNANVVSEILKDSKYLKAGYNYVFTFNVGKTKIKNITAQVAEWENVEATQLIPTNARINLNLEERGTTITDAADIYRAEDNSSEITDTWQSYNWATGYVGHGNVFSNASGSWKLTTDWFWPGNTYHYHFRAIMPGNGATGAPTVKTADEKDYVELTSGTDYTDIRWGAPFTDVTPGNEAPDPTTLNWTYDPVTNGFDGKDATATKHQINYAIGPTEDKIKLILFHMMSELEFIITTSATGSEQVVLGDGVGSNVTKVELLNYYPEGRVLLGNGLVQTTGDKTNAFTLTNNLSASSNNCTFGIVPQAITDDLQLRITTPDHNQYYVKLKDVLASTVTAANLVNPYTASGGKYIIDRWYPGYKYKYTLNLLKKGVTNITATIVNWETVTAGNDNVQIR